MSVSYLVSVGKQNFREGFKIIFICDITLSVTNDKIFKITTFSLIIRRKAVRVFRIQFCNTKYFLIQLKVYIKDVAAKKSVPVVSTSIPAPPLVKTSIIGSTNITKTQVVQNPVVTQSSSSDFLSSIIQAVGIQVND